MGILYIDRYRIYGRGWRRKPTDIPYDIYKENSKCLVDAAYRGDYLRKHFGNHVKDIVFTVKELKHLPKNVLASLASQLGVLKRRGPRRDLKYHDVPRTQIDLAKEIIKALRNVA